MNGRKAREIRKKALAMSPEGSRWKLGYRKIKRFYTALPAWKKPNWFVWFANS